MLTSFYATEKLQTSQMISQAVVCVFLFSGSDSRMFLPYKVDSAKAAMAYFPQVREKLLRVFFEEQLGHLRILQAPCPYRRGHPAERSPSPPTQRDYLGAEQHRSSLRVIWGSRGA